MASWAFYPMSMLYVTGISALWQWRMLENPQNALSACRLKQRSLSDCPKSISQLEAEARLLPPSRRPWYLMTSSPELRFRQQAYRYVVCSRTVPVGAFYRVNRSVCIASPQLVFVQLARSLPLALLVKLGDELCGTYTSTFDEEGQDRRRNAPLCSVATLGDFIEAVPWMRGSTCARRALPFIVEGSCSARESDLEMLLCLPQRHGGFGLPKPQMNMRVDFDHVAGAQARQTFARCDLCWPESKLDVEYDGRMWHEDEERAWHDKARVNGLQHMGYHVVTVSNAEFENRALLDSIAIDLAKIVGHRLRITSSDAFRKRDELHKTLLNSWQHPVFKRVNVSDAGIPEMLRLVWE